MNLTALPEPTTSTMRNVSELTEVVKKTIDKIYEIPTITDIVYNTIKKRNFEDADDLLDDIDDRNKSRLITQISQLIEANNSITYEWNDEDNNNLYEILMKIYKDNINNLDKYDREIFEI
eukprot:445158_1